jgi:RNA polymerase sigma factor (sigma-70 family)
METISTAPVSTRVPRPPARLSRLRDETLATLTQKGNEQAFSALYERYHQVLYRYCRTILRNDADAQDALQSAFTSGLAALQRGQRKAPVRPWLFRIAHNEAITLLRRRRSAEDLWDAPPQVACSAEEREAERTRFSQLVADLSELPERVRGALLMRELSGLSHEEIALALGTSAGAAKQAIFDARRALHEFAEGRAMECEEIRRHISDGDGRVLRGRRLRAHLRDCAPCSALPPRFLSGARVYGHWRRRSRRPRPRRCSRA